MIQKGLFDAPPEEPAEPTGDQLRDRGMAQAAAHAEAIKAGWNDRADQLFAEYARLHPDQPFFTMDVRLWAEANGFSKPPDRRAWGAVARRAAEARVVRVAGDGKYPDPVGHSGWRRTWIRL